MTDGNDKKNSQGANSEWTDWNRDSVAQTEKEGVEEYLEQFESGYHDKALEVGGANSAVLGGILTAVSAVIASALISIHLVILGFGWQRVATDVDSLATLAIAVAFAGFVFLFSARRTLMKNDQKRVQAHRKRTEKFIECRNLVAKVEKQRARYDASVSAYREFRESRSTFGRNIRSVREIANSDRASRLQLNLDWLYNQVTSNALELNQKEKEREQEARKKKGWISNRDSEIVAFKRAQPENGRLFEEMVYLKDLLEAMPGFHRAAMSQDDLLNKKSQFRLMSEVFLDRQFIKTTGLIVIAAIGLRTFFSLTPYMIGERYCARDAAPLYLVPLIYVANTFAADCVHLEVKRPGSGTKSTKVLEPVLVHGTVDGNVFASKLTNGFWASERFKVPEETVVAQRAFSLDPPYERIGRATEPVAPAARVTLKQTNSFNSFSNTANSEASSNASGPGGNGNSVVLNSNNSFVTHEENNLNSETHFETEENNTIVENNYLSASYIVDGKPIEMSHKENENSRHFLVPFFLNPVKSPKEDGPLKDLYFADGTAGISSELDAFMSGFTSLKDPEFEAEGIQIKGLGEDWPKAYLSTVKRILNSCSLPNKGKLTIDLAGYASKKPFTDEKGNRLDTSDQWNHALAEGRRMAVALRLVDFQENENSEINSLIKLEPDLNVSKEIMELLGSLSDQDYEKAHKMLMTGGLIGEMQAIFENPESASANGFFKFKSETEMRGHLADWANTNEQDVAGDEGERSAIEEAFQRSVVISIPEQVLANCGVKAEPRKN